MPTGNRRRSAVGPSWLMPWSPNPCRKRRSAPYAR